MEKIVLTDLKQIDWSLLPRDAKVIAFDEDGVGNCCTTERIFFDQSGHYFKGSLDRWMDSPYCIDTSKIDWRESKVVRPEEAQKTIKQIVAEKMILNDEKVPACQVSDSPITPQPGQFGSFYNNEIDEGRLSILGGIVENGFRNQAGFFYKHFNPISAFDLFELLKKAPDFGEWQKAQAHNQEPQPIQQVKKVSEIQALAETGKDLSASIMYGNKPVRYARDIKLLGED